MGVHEEVILSNEQKRLHKFNILGFSIYGAKRA